MALFSVSKQSFQAVIKLESASLGRRDRTLMQRKLVSQTYTELKESNEKGEFDIITKYFNGMPLIINRPQDITRPPASKT